MSDFSRWVEAKAPKWGVVPQGAPQTPEDMLRAWEQMKGEWVLYKKMGPKMFYPLFEKMKGMQEKYQALTGQPLDPEFKYW